MQKYFEKDKAKEDFRNVFLVLFLVFWFLIR